MKIRHKNRKLIKRVEHAKKLKDLEIAKSLEVDKIKYDNYTENKKLTTPVVRSDLPKE